LADRQRTIYGGGFEHLIHQAGFLVVPALAFLAIFYLLPLSALALISVNAPAYSAVNYVDFFQSPANSRVLIRTLGVGVSVTVACVILGYPTAYALCRAGKYQRPLLLLVIVPYLTSFLVRTYAWIVLLGRKGVINSVLLASGMTDRPLDLIYNGFAVHVGMIHVMLPVAILPMYSVMRGIDPQLLMAAKSLGSGPLRSHLRVFFPLTIPGVVSGGLLVFLLSVGFYITPILLGGLRDVMLAAFIDAQVSQLANWGFAAAAAFVLLFVTLLGYFGVCWVTGLKLGRPLQKQPLDGTTATSPLPALIGRGFRMAAELLNKVRRRTDAAVRLSTLAFPTSQKQSFAADAVARWFVCIWASAILLYLILPTLIVVPLSFSSSPHLQFPPPGFSLRWYEGYFGNPAWINPTLLSVEVAVASMVLSTALGTFAAYALVRGRLRAPGLITGVLISPMIVPAIVLGVALYRQFAAWGMIGSSLGLILCHSIGALPYVLIIVSATLAGLDTSLERASLTLGAGPVRTFLKVTVPLIRPGIISAALLAFIHSFDELVITMFVAGARVQTLPLKMWENIRAEIDPTIAAVSCLLISLPVVLLAVNWFAQRWRKKFAPLADLAGVN